MKSFKPYLKENRWIRRILALIFHLVGIVAAYYVAFEIRFEFTVPSFRWMTFRETLGWVVVSYFACIFGFRLYRGLWRFFTLRDCIITAVAFGVGTVLAAGVIFVAKDLSFTLYPRSVLIVTFLLLLLWEVGGRGLVRLYRETQQSRPGAGAAERRLLLIGNPEQADALLRSIQGQSLEIGQIVGIVSDNPSHQGSQLRGVSIHSGIDKVVGLVEKLDIATLLFLPPFTSPRIIRETIDRLSEQKRTCDFRVIPSMDDIVSGKINVSRIRKVSIEDLLQRIPYKVEKRKLEMAIKGKRILVSGAGGSIGSEICRQILDFSPESLVLFDVSEFHLFQIERELVDKARNLGVKLVAVAGDTRRPEHVRSAIRKCGGADLYYHAAAYKHVDLMERNVASCIQNNVIGTEVAVSVAEEEGVKDFVLISTDKAVRPTSLMGASKRLAEKLIMDRPASGTSCKAVRFGNVLGSNGSVVPIFREQILKGGPVTVTSPDVTRFFMTIPEAVELVISAGAVEEDRRIFVLEMGEPVVIDSMARRMIELSGLIPDVDIPVVYTGLKRGEKAYEELLTDDEDVVSTDLDRIWVVKKNASSRGLPVDIGYLLELIDDGDEEAIRQYAHSVIPGSKLYADEKTVARV